MDIKKHYKLTFRHFTKLSYRLATVSAHTSGTDPFVYFDAYLSSGDKCAQQKPVTGWTVDQRYRDATGARGTDPFTTSTGLFVTPVAGRIVQQLLG